MSSLDSKAVTYMAFNLLSSVSIVFVNKVRRSCARRVRLLKLLCVVVFPAACAPRRCAAAQPPPACLSHTHSHSHPSDHHHDAQILFKTYAFPFSTFVTACHFIVTSIGVYICGLLGMYEPKKLRHRDVLPITLAFCGFVVFNNLSLQHNSIGFYQLMKVLTTPVIVVLQMILYKVPLDNRLKIALVPVIVGVGMATVSDFSFNMVGFLWAVAGIMATSFYQLGIKSKEKELGTNSFQLLRYQSTQAAVVVLCLTPFLDDVVHGGDGGLVNTLMTSKSTGMWVALLVSCALAFCVNLSIFLVVSVTNPLSYNVLGHFKLIIVLTSGIVFFGGDTNPIRLAGMGCAFIGVLWYTHLKLKVGVASGWDKKKTKKEEEESPESAIEAGVNEAQDA
jgi:solute carrier family 35 protein E3